MMTRRLATLATYALALAPAVVLSVAIAQPADAAGIVPCEYEDSRSCVWDARHMGNRSGRSFIAGPNGGVKYITHARAHRLLFGGK